MHALRATTNASHVCSVLFCVVHEAKIENIVCVADCGATSRASITSALPLAARISIKPPPLMGEKRELEMGGHQRHKKVGKNDINARSGGT